MSPSQTKFKSHSETKILWLLIGLMGGIALIAITAANLLSYQTALKAEGEHLRMIAASQARWIESFARFDALNSLPGNPHSWQKAALSQVKEGHKMFHGYGRTGEFLIGIKKGNEIEYLLDPMDELIAYSPKLPWEHPAALPMRRALEGQSGVIEAVDFSGQSILVAYEPVMKLNAGFVVTITLAEIRAPYLHTGGIALVITLVMVGVGAFLFIRINASLMGRLEEGESRFRAILETLVDGLITIDERGTILYSNPGIKKIFGYASEELIGRNVKILMPEPYHSSHDGYLGNYLHTGERKVISIGREVHGKRKDGGVFPMNLTVSEFQARGRRYFAGMVRDTTLEKANEAALMEGRWALSEAQRIAHVGSFDWDMAQGQIVISDEAFRILGMEPNSAPISIDTILSMVHPEDQNSVQGYLQDTLEKGVEFNFETRIVQKSGNIRTTHVRGEVSRGPIDAPAHLLGVVFDITEQKAVEDALREREHRLSEAQRIAHLGSWTWHIVTGGLSWSDEIYRIFGLEPGVTSPTYEAFLERVHPEDRQKVQEAVNAAMNGERPYNCEHRIVRPDGQERVVLEQGEVVRDSEGAALRMVGTVLDITERKKVEIMKNEFISTVSHELRTPLTSIVGSLGLLQGAFGSALPADVLSMVNIALSNSERLVRLINDILDIEKIESGRMEFALENLDLGALLEHSLETNRAYGEPFKVSLRLEHATPGVKVKGDSDRLQQVMANLLSNAVKFSPPGGTVTVSTLVEHGRVRIHVIDTGPGIPESFQSLVFEKFTQADSTDTRQKGGTGLGLSICKSIVERHGGVIGFQTQAGQGTTFHFDLPLLESREDLKSVDHGSENDTLPRVLACEDDAVMAALISATLEHSGYRVDVAPTGKLAREMLTRHQYAVITLDMLLPDEDGVSLLRHIRIGDRTAEIPVVVISGSTELENRLNANVLNVNCILEKPVRPDQILQAVRDALKPGGSGRPRVLHVEDDRDLTHVVSALAGEFVELEVVRTLEAARTRIRKNAYDLVILDLVLPDGNGSVLLDELRQVQPKPKVIIFSAQEISREVASQVKAALVKSRTSNAALVRVIREAIADAAAGSA